MRKIDFLLGTLQMLSMTTLCALPKGGQTVDGSAALSYSKQGKLEITSKNGTVIHWDEFSIDPGELTQFIQESAKSAVFNRVVGKVHSNILGTLESNGHVFLINPNGVTIHKEGVINTAGFLATSLDFDMQKFLNGEETPFQGQGSVINLGRVTASEGDVYLLGMQVDNQGTIQAPSGFAFLGAAQNIILKPSQDKGIFVVVTPSSVKNEGAALTNKGLVEAIQVQMKADGNPYTFAIQDDGVTAATGIKNIDGVIVLTAESGSVIERGSMTAKNTSGIGGTVHLLGDEVHLLEKASIEASGVNGGGTVLIGGDYQGKNPDIRNSQLTFIEKDVTIYADAKEQGDGGRVIVWSEGATDFQGKIFARGGPQEGNGGFAEISGKENLLFTGFPDLTAVFGKPGHLLLDPNITVVAAGVAPACGVNLGAPTSYDNGNIFGLSFVLNSGCSVTLQAAGVGATITVSDPVIWTTPANLTLIADSTITINAPLAHYSTVNTASITVTSLTGDITITPATVGTIGYASVENENGPISISAPNGDISILARNVPVGAPEAVLAPALVGFLGFENTGVWPAIAFPVTPLAPIAGDIFMECGGTLTITGGFGLPVGSLRAIGQVYNYAGVGRFGLWETVFSTEISTGTTTINVGTNCILTPGDGQFATAIIGVEGNRIGWPLAGGSVFIGDINLNVGGNVEMVTSVGSGASVIGSVSAPQQANMRINAGENLYLHNNPGTTGFIGCQIGGAFNSPDAQAWNQNIFINVGNNMTMDARSFSAGFSGAFTCIQPYNGQAGPTDNGILAVHVGGDLVLIAGSDAQNQSYMLLHSEAFTTEVWVGGNIRCFNGGPGNVQDAAFPVPFAFNTTGGPDFGTVDIRAGGNIIMGGGHLNSNGFFSTTAYQSTGFNGSTGSIYFEADALFPPGLLWSLAPVPVGVNPNIFTGTPLATPSTSISTVAPFKPGGNGLGGFAVDTARYNMTAGAFPATSVTGFSASITSPFAPVAPSSPANTAISYTSLVSTVTIFSEDRFSDGTPCDLLICNSFLPYNVAGLGTGYPNHVGVQSFDNLTIGNFRNIVMNAFPTGSGGIPMPGGPLTNGGGAIQIIANNDMTMNASTSVSTHPVFGGEINLVVDNQGPVPPQIGGVWSAAGRFLMDASATITTIDELRVFTACQPFNIISGLLNGVPFVPGPLCVDTNTERWGIWFFDPFFVADYTIFYKCVCIEDIIGLTTPPIQEFLIGLHGPSEYLGWVEQFSEEYTDGGKKKPKYVGTSYDFANNEKYRIRLKYHRMSNPKSYTAN